MTQTLDLIALLKQMPDYRKGKGKRHALWLVLMLILLGSLCGYRGYRPLADFSQQHWQRLCELLALPSSTRIPSYSTFRRVLQRVDFEPFVELFNQWSQRFIRLTEETWVAADGKSIKSTLSAYSESYQDFSSSVSAFTHQSGVVLHLEMMHNKQISEIEVVQQLIAALAGQPVVFSLDALHCQKNSQSNPPPEATLFDCAQSQPTQSGTDLEAMTHNDPGTQRSRGVRCHLSASGASSRLGLLSTSVVATAVGRFEMPDLGGTVGHSRGQVVSRTGWLHQRLRVKRR